MAGLNSISVALQGVGSFDPPHMALLGWVVAVAVETRGAITKRVETEREETRTVPED